MELKRTPFNKLDVIKELELCTLYSIGFSTWMLSKFYDVSQWTPCNTTHKYYQLGILEKVRNNEESTRARCYLEGKATVFPTFPSTSLILDLMNKGLNKYLDRLICVMLLTDGFASSQVIQMNNNSEIMHKVFFDLMFTAFGVTPTSFRKSKLKNQTSYVRKEMNKIFEKLNMHTPSFRTSPSRSQKIEEYLSKPQPSLEFLLDSSKEIQTEAFRLGMCAEGSITPTLRGSRVTGMLNFACAHPKLVVQWLKISKSLGFSGFHVIKNKKNWSGIGGISTTMKDDLKHFLELGGFLNGVKIGKGSPYYSGIDKQYVLISLLKFMESNKKVARFRELHSIIRALTMQLRE